MQIGIDSFAAAISDPATGVNAQPGGAHAPSTRRDELADKVGLDIFGIGEHHRAEFLDSAPVVISPLPPRARKISVVGTLPLIGLWKGCPLIRPKWR
jgi:alkanesulfonate monooxygenase SsuD/methylene tetrahydromethanopterin reductase-like flavin-dependent oxidoreductase (luciferase family)